MAAIGEIVTGSDITALQKEMQKSVVTTGYVAPTVYRYSKVSNWNYYNSLSTALKQWGYLNGLKGYVKQTPAGYIPFSSAATETVGINVDFYYYLPTTGFVSVPYSWIRTVIAKPGFTCVIRFYKTDGSGPYFAVLDNRYFAAAATVIQKVPADKLQAIDTFHREVQLLKYKYNSLAIYLTSLSKKKLNATQQQIFNEGVIMLNNLQNQLKQIKGIEINWQTSGQVGEPITIATIFLISLIAAIISWTVITVNNEIQKVKKLNASYDFQKWISSQNLKIQQDKSLTQAQKNALISENSTAASAAQKNAEQAAAPQAGVFDKIENILMLAIVGLAVIKFIPNSKSN